jgi:hypothetical protein
MDKPTLEQVLEAARKLSIADQQRLVRLLNPPKTIEQIAKEQLSRRRDPDGQLRPPKTIEQLAEEQRIKPTDWETLTERARGIWPEDESIDDFLAFLKESRKDHRPPRDFGDIDDDDPLPGQGIIDPGKDSGPESGID